MRAIESFSLLSDYYHIQIRKQCDCFYFQWLFCVISKRASAIMTNLCFAKMNDVVSEGSFASDVDHSRDRIFKYPYFLPENLLIYHDRFDPNEL